jgi:hypothetical protein
MPVVVVSLGEFIFDDWEIPTSLRFGGQQLQAVHQLVGGGRVVDVMGVSNADISWSGQFLGVDAIQRSRFVQNMLNSGLQYTFKYYDFLYNVVIKDFVCDLEASFKIPFSLTLTVVEDLTNPVTIEFPPAYSEIVQDALIEAQELSELIADPGLTAKMAALAGAIATAGDFGDSSFGAIAAVIAAAQDAISAAGAIAGSL